MWRGEITPNGWCFWFFRGRLGRVRVQSAKAAQGLGGVRGKGRGSCL